MVRPKPVSRTTPRTCPACSVSVAVQVAAVLGDLGQALVVGLAHGVQRHRRPVAGEHGAVLGRLDLVGGAAVVEAGRDLHLEGHLPADATDHPHEQVPVGRDGTADRHEVGHLPHTLLGHEAGDQDRRVGEVQLRGGEGRGARADPEPAALLGGPAVPRRCSASRTSGRRTSRPSRPRPPARRSAGRRSGRGRRSGGSRCQPWSSLSFDVPEGCPSPACPVREPRDVAILLRPPARQPHPRGMNRRPCRCRTLRRRASPPPWCGEVVR